MGSKRIQLPKMLFLGVVLIPFFLNCPISRADLIVVKEVVIAPKNGRVAANIGPVNQTVNVEMRSADVSINLSKLPAPGDNPLSVHVTARFSMVNSFQAPLSLTIGFPVSDSEYSSCKHVSFTVTSDGQPRTVFERVTGYPWKMIHRPVSGPPGNPADLMPDVANAALRKGLYKSKDKNRPIFGGDVVGESKFHNLMVWGENFQPGQQKIIEVVYSLAIPLQKNVVRKTKAKGNYKGVWPQEANNLPKEFLDSIPKDKQYYFFDYFLTSGASWKGPIGKEVVNLNLDESWSGHRLYCNLESELFKSQVKNGHRYTFRLTKKEPDKNLYFALIGP